MRDGDDAYIDADQVDLSVTVLTRLGGRHVDDLARTTCKMQRIAAAAHRARQCVFGHAGWGVERTLDDDVTVLAESRALHGEGGRSPSAGLEKTEKTQVSCMCKILPRCG